MAYYCSECVTWVNSKDGDRYGRKYCTYSRRYEEPDQNIYGCRGFVYAGRVILTKVCEILGVNPDTFFASFDETKDVYLVPSCIDKLIDYSTVGTVIVNSMDNYPEKKQLANNMLNGYIIPAEANARMGKYQEAVSIYERMVKVLAIIFHATKDDIQENAFYDSLDNLIKVR